MEAGGLGGPRWGGPPGPAGPPQEPISPDGLGWHPKPCSSAGPRSGPLSRAASRGAALSLPRGCAKDHARLPRAGLTARISSETGVDGMLLADRTDMLVADVRGWSELVAAWLIAAAGLACLWLA